MMLTAHKKRLAGVSRASLFCVDVPKTIFSLRLYTYRTKLEYDQSFCLGLMA